MKYFLSFASLSVVALCASVAHAGCLADLRGVQDKVVAPQDVSFETETRTFNPNLLTVKIKGSELVEVDLGDADVAELAARAKARIGKVAAARENLYIDVKLLKCIEMSSLSGTRIVENDKIFTEDRVPFAFYSVKERAHPPVLDEILRTYIVPDFFGFY